MENVIVDAVETAIQFRVEINETTPSVLICVYGTLRAGENNHGLLRGCAEYLGTYKSEPSFTMYGRRAGFPILSDEGTTSITYEVYKITEASVLERIHRLEGCSGIPGNEQNWYDIVPINTPLGDGWIYVQHNFQPSIASIISTGDWKNKSL